MKVAGFRAALCQLRTEHMHITLLR